MALAVGDAGDQHRVDAVATVGKDAVAGGHLHRGDRARTQGHGQVGWVLLCIEAEMGHPVLRVVHANRLQHADGDHVLGLGQRLLQRHRAIKVAVVILRLPGLTARGAGVEEQRRIVHDRERRKAFFKRCRIDEGLETRSRLAPGLNRVVELVFVEIKAAHQGADGAGGGFEGNQCALDFRLLSQHPVAATALDGPHDGAATDLYLGPRLVRQARGHRLQPLTGHCDQVPRLQHCHHLARAGFEHHGGLQLVIVRVIDQGLGDADVHFFGVCRQVDIGLRAPVDLAPFIVQQAAPQGPVGGDLVAGVDGDMHFQAACGGLLAVLGEDQLPYGFSHVLGMHLGFLVAAIGHHLLVRFVGLCGVDEAVVQHALDDVLLAPRRPLRVGDRVVGRWRLRQAGQHGGFGDGHLFERFAEINLAGGGKTVGALAEENLVHIDLQNLLLAELTLDLQSQQDLVDLAREGLLRGEVEISRHLHRDG